jgi:hypothetical protein
MKREQNSRYDQHNWLRFLADYAAKKWPFRGSKNLGHLAIPRSAFFPRFPGGRTSLSISVKT